MAEGLADVGADAVDLADLRQFLRHPVRSFFQRRLEVRLPRDEPGASDTLPVKLDPLEGWALGEGLLDLDRHGLDPAHWLRIEQARGAPPAAALGEASDRSGGRRGRRHPGSRARPGFELDPRSTTRSTCRWPACASSARSGPAPTDLDQVR